ncbi:hypothetical protein BEWA_022570 [Theileria equi strain WA]|uniref:HSA domain-containing protein n=1 Tax=Theileria equi strain WA TaxID=1537102 RepID=L0AX07_THEEQ|nr:hypothetical protein BEWA_022570 [Theileria equi strain WA]AFZ79409.1 hypothetical protein BEWA_022570 [Theileria equi strain WA]|eukprot:XP_004829075.1 hypothetical protein BEWA_022570 [Theileria equi strain WA]
MISDNLIDAPSTSFYPNAPPSPFNSKPEKKRLKMSEFEMWRYAYSLVKNGYSILAPEPSQRSRSYRDLILQEMNWMAIDYYQERRWKTHVAKELSGSINKAIRDKRKLKRDWPARLCSYHVTKFWSNLQASSQITDGLRDYCSRLVKNTGVPDLSLEFMEDVPNEEADLLAVTVPLCKNISTNVVKVSKNEVMNTTVTHLLGLGAELYPQIYRPPDDDLDVFTLPALQPKHEHDYNTLMLLIHTLKGNNSPMIPKHEQLNVYANVSRTFPPQTSFGSMLPIRRIPRDDIDPFCLSVNYRDFIETPPAQPANTQKLVLKWDEVVPNENDFELLDSWMLRDCCWPLISIALNLRSSSGGLLRREFHPQTCEAVFSKLSRTPRGLINSSRKLLGPKQSKTILSVIDPPPKPKLFRPIIPIVESLHDMCGQDKKGLKDSGCKLLFGDLVDKNYKGDCRVFSYNVVGTKSSKSDGNIFSKLRLYSESKTEKKRIVLREVATDKVDAALLVPTCVRHEVYISNEHDEVDYNSIKELCAINGSRESLMKKLGYSEWSNRIRRQLRIGFWGIPTKMFVYSLFYSGRVRKDFRVRRVALSISKLAPSNHLLYTKIFEPDINSVLGKSRAWDKQRSKSFDSQTDSYSSELMQGYMTELHSAPTEETNISQVIAAYTKVALGKGHLASQGTFSDVKILNFNSAPCTVASQSENKRKAQPIDVTPKQQRPRQYEQVDKGEIPMQFRARPMESPQVMRRPPPVQMYNVPPQVMNNKIIYNQMPMGSPPQLPIQQHWPTEEEMYHYRFNDNTRQHR